MAMYFIGYGVGRFWIEGMRIDEADHVGGLRFNQWVALSMIVVGTIAMLLLRRYPVAEPDELLRRRRTESGDDPMITPTFDGEVSQVDDDRTPGRTDAETPASE